MKNRKCPQKKHCWGYHNGSCEDCGIGECIDKLHRKIDKLSKENEKLNSKVKLLEMLNNPPF